MQGVRRRPRRRSDQRGERAERRRMRGGKDDVCVCVVCVCVNGFTTTFVLVCLCQVCVVKRDV